MKPLVIYHADCTDGFGAAFAAWLKLGDEAEYLPMQYDKNTSPDVMAEKCRSREVYVLDFSFERKVTEHIFQAAKRIVWLDHHKTAFEMWCAESPLHWEQTENKWITLDNNKSGALLAWEHFHPDTKVPALIRHIDDRDRWQFKLEGSRELHAALQSHRPWSFEQWRDSFWSPYTGNPEYFEEELKRLLSDGVAILRAQEQNIASMLKQARKCRITGSAGYVDGLALNAPIHQSEIGHELANASGTFGLVWYLSADNRAKCSLRSNGNYDVSAIARAFGGGGHRNAAGFEVDVDTLMGWLV